MSREQYGYDPLKNNCKGRIKRVQRVANDLPQKQVNFDGISSVPSLLSCKESTLVDIITSFEYNLGKLYLPLYKNYNTSQALKMIRVTKKLKSGELALYKITYGEVYIWKT